MKTYREILEQMMTGNEGRGFHGVAYDRLNSKESAAAQAFSRHCTMLSKHFGEPEESMRDFMDSIAGRHFADSLSDDEMAGKKKPNYKSDKPLNKDMKIHLKG
jgi:hypothetical protein